MDNNQNDMDKKTIEHLERMKEVQRIEYDYFKFMIPICPPMIAIIIAFFEYASTPNLLVVIFACLSVIGFAASIIVAMLGIPSTVNMIMYVNKLQVAIGVETELALKKQMVKEVSPKIDETLDVIGRFNRGLQISFIGGITMLLISAVVYFFFN